MSERPLEFAGTRTLAPDAQAIEHERMDVDVQIQRRAETLDDGHGTTATSLGPRLPRPAPQRAQHRSHEDARRPRGTTCDPTRARSAAGAAGSRPTAEPALPERPDDRPGAPRARPCGDRRNSNTRRAPYTRTARADRHGTTRSKSARTRLRDVHSAGTLETPPR